jgi:hypothetical protein
MVMSAQQVALCCIQSVLKSQTLASRKSVLQKAQNQGISTQLLDKIMQKALADNVSKVFALSRHNAQWSDIFWTRYDSNLIIFFYCKTDHFRCVRELGIICFYMPTLYVH